MKQLDKDERDAIDRAFWKSVETIDEGYEKPEQSKKAVTDEELLEALSKVYDDICQNQTELDPESKRILYANLRDLYLH